MAALDLVLESPPAPASAVPLLAVSSRSVGRSRSCEVTCRCLGFLAERTGSGRGARDRRERLSIGHHPFFLSPAAGERKRKTRSTSRPPASRPRPLLSLPRDLSSLSPAAPRGGERRHIEIERDLDRNPEKRSENAKGRRNRNSLLFFFIKIKIKKIKQ